MKNPIETLSSIDARASRIMENASAQKAALAREFDEKAQIISGQIREEAKTHMNELAAALDADNTREITRLSREADENLARLDADYTTNHNRYVEEIFSRITGV